MSERIACPLPDQKEVWIELPDGWKGDHADRRDRTLEKLENRYGQTLSSFAVSLALLDNWNIPSLAGKPEKWDFLALDLTLIAWVNEVTLTPFLDCFRVSKNS